MKIANLKWNKCRCLMNLKKQQKWQNRIIGLIGQGGSGQGEFDFVISPDASGLVIGN